MRNPILFVVLLFASPALARDSRPTVVVYPKAMVQEANITLGSIARVRSSEEEHSKLVEELRAIEIALAPAPKTSMTLMGAQVLSKIEEAGYSPELFGYSIPRSINVERAGTVVAKEQVLEAARRVFRADKKLDLKVRDVQLHNSQVIPLGETKMRIEVLGLPAAGKVPLRVEVTVNDDYAARFLATAVVDDWREVPVMTRALERGMLVSPEDVQLVRLNLLKEPQDVIDDLSAIVGRRVVRRLKAGETVRRSQVDIPPVIPRGQAVVMHYRKGGLHVTAKGHALEDGHHQEIIAVKNSDSRKIVRGKVVSENQVEVLNQ